MQVHGARAVRGFAETEVAARKRRMMGAVGSIVNVVVMTVVMLVSCFVPM